jgi:hypothetical protein
MYALLINCYLLNVRQISAKLRTFMNKDFPQPVHKACHESDRLFLCEAAKQACLIERMSVKKGNETRSGSLKSFG